MLIPGKGSLIQLIDLRRLFPCQKEKGILVQRKKTKQKKQRIQAKNEMKILQTQRGKGTFERVCNLCYRPLPDRVYEAEKITGETKFGWYISEKGNLHICPWCRAIEPKYKQNRE